MKYSVDTSAFIQSWRRYYPPDVFPSVWRMLDALVRSGDLVAIDEVRTELDKKDDEVLKWVMDRKQLFAPISDAIQQAVRQVLQQSPRLLDTRLNRSGADPFVIALAMVEELTVVTEERATGSADRPNIPDVCNDLGVPCIDVIGMIRAEGRQF